MTRQEKIKILQQIQSGQAKIGELMNNGIWIWHLMGDKVKCAGPMENLEIPYSELDEYSEKVGGRHYVVEVILSDPDRKDTTQDELDRIIQDKEREKEQDKIIRVEASEVNESEKVIEVEAVDDDCPPGFFKMSDTEKYKRYRERFKLDFKNRL